MEQVIETTEVKKKLNGGGFSSYHLDEFCRVLAIRLQSETTPLGFLLTFELLISDMENGTGRKITWGGMGEGINTSLAGLPIGGVCRLALPLIVRKVFPEDFATSVLREMKEVQAEAKAKFD